MRLSTGAISTYLTTGTESPPKSIGRQRYRESARQPGRHWSAKKYTLSPTTRGKAPCPRMSCHCLRLQRGRDVRSTLPLFCRPRTCVPYWRPPGASGTYHPISAVFLKQDRSLVVSGRENAYIFACMGVVTTVEFGDVKRKILFGRINMIYAFPSSSAKQSCRATSWPQVNHG